jgi:hypothetical protein
MFHSTPAIVEFAGYCQETGYNAVVLKLLGVVLIGGEIGVLYLCSIWLVQEASADTGRKPYRQTVVQENAISCDCNLRPFSQAGRQTGCEERPDHSRETLVLYRK